MARRWPWDIKTVRGVVARIVTSPHDARRTGIPGRCPPVAPVITPVLDVGPGCSHTWTMERVAADRLLVLIDGGCPLCRRTARVLHAVDWRGRLAFADGTDATARERWAPGLDEVALLRRCTSSTGPGRAIRDSRATSASRRWSRCCGPLRLPATCPASGRSVMRPTGSSPRAARVEVVGPTISAGQPRSRARRSPWCPEAPRRSGWRVFPTSRCRTDRRATTLRTPELPVTAQPPRIVSE